jgi:4-hydroxybenzoate polyprenyltransferase
MGTVFAAAASPRNQKSLLSIIRMSVTEARPSVLGMFMLRYATGAVLAFGQVTACALVHIVAAGLSLELTVFSIYLFNGVMDVAEDRINGSRRPIARGDLPQGSALWIAIGSAASAFVGGFLLGGQLTWLLPALIFLGFAYSAPPFYLKRHVLTTIMTGFLLGWLSYSVGNAAAGKSFLTGENLLFAGALSAWTALVGSMAKDLPDALGDAAAGRRTVATLLGERRIRIVMPVTVFALSTGFLVCAAVTDTLLVWPAAAMTVGATAVTRATLKVRPASDRRERRGPYRAFMITQYAAHLCLLAAVALAGR